MEKWRREERKGGKERERERLKEGSVRQREDEENRRKVRGRGLKWGEWMCQ